jgi:NusA-like KH domain protein
MAGTIDMKHMRYINLFSKISKVPTTKCFVYNGQIVFAVPQAKVSIAIGKGAANIKKLRNVLGRKIKVVAMPIADDNEGIRKFIKEVIEPVEFTKIDIKDNSLIITAGRQNKAALIGRNRMREKELSEVLKNFFQINKFKIA